jgi:RimJ/RimL family protein N-acetyltransferase
VRSADEHGGKQLVSIRKLIENDAEALWRLRLYALETDPVSFAESPEELKRTKVEDYAARLRSGGAENFVVGAFDGEQLVGMTGFYRDLLLKRRHIGHIWGVFVSPSARGKGVGRGMLAEVIQSAKALPGLLCVRLTAAVTQEAARHLHLAAGFRVFGIEPRSLKIGERFVDENHLTLEFQVSPG